MKRLLIYFLLVAISSSTSYANSRNEIRAAGAADKTFVLYLEADYDGPDAGSASNLRIKAAKVIVVQDEENSGKPKRLDMVCKDNQSILRNFQASPYGRGSEGRALGLKCSPQGEFIFVLVKDKGRNGDFQDCVNSHMLYTKSVALAASFGHQAFCLEDWSAVKDPGTQLDIEFNKLRGRK